MLVFQRDQDHPAAVFFCIKILVIISTRVRDLAKPETKLYNT